MANELKKFTLASGRKLDMNIADIKIGWRLHQAFIREFKKNGIDIQMTVDEIKNIDLPEKGQKFKIGELLLKLVAKHGCKFVSGLLDVMTSDAVLDILLECGDRCIYNGKKVTMESFEDEDNRADFFEVLKIVLTENLLPFFPALRTLLKPISAKA